jgi:hypothetical protein
VVNEEDFDEILDDGPVDNQNESYMGATSLGTGINSPAPFLMSKNNSYASPIAFKKSSSIFSQNGSPLTV